MTTARFVVEGRLDIKNIEANMDKLKALFREIGDPGSSKVFEHELAKVQKYRDAIQDLKRDLKELETYRRNLAKGNIESAPSQVTARANELAARAGVSREQALHSLGTQDRVTKTFNKPTPRTIQMGEIALAAKMVAEYNSKLENSQTQMKATEQGAVAMVQRLREVQTAGPPTSQYLGLIRQVNEELTKGTAKGQVQLGAAGQIEAEIDKLAQQRAELEAALAKQGTQKQQQEYSKVTGFLRQANKHRENAITLTRQLREEEAKISGNVPALDRAAGQQRIDRLREARAFQRSESERLLREAARPQSQQDERVRLAGAGQALEDMDRRMAGLLLKQKEVFTDGFVQDAAPELAQLNAEMVNLNKLLANSVEGSKQQERWAQKVAEQRERINKAVRDANQQQVVPPGQGALTPAEHTANLQRMVPGIDRLFTGIFSDMARRFVATLQFSISAALIFGTQKLIKEFIQSAIEVERAFADIRTALTFDIDAPEGSLEFERQVEAIRREVLLLSNELNILPSEANEAAYVMVARFSNAENAVTALRAQLLATKVSGIDMSEVLRALTATAETFASSVLETNDSMSLQEKLMERETVAARNYTKALDIAVKVQQRYGIETEDTLEGTARAAEVFRQMGFSLEETSAIVAASSRQLGQTGQQVAERLNRSLGQLTDPAIRDALLDLAAANEEFNLGIGDFGSGADAWKKIVSQFESLERVAPSVAREILQIIGQRRELEAVAAALGTTDIQRDMLRDMETSAGAAQDRFNELSRTMEEIVKSIGAEFQSLAQNLEVLGGITSFKILLQTLETILSTVNRLAEGFGYLIEKLDELFGLKVGDRGVASIVVQFGFLTAATLGSARAVLALVRAYKQLSQIQALSAITNFMSLGGGRNVVGPRPIQGGIKSAVGIRAPIMGAQLAAGAQAATTAMASFASSAVGGATIVIGAAVLLATAFKELEDRSKRLEDSYASGKDEVNKSVAATIRMARAQGEATEAIHRLAEQSRLEATRRAAAAAPSGGLSLLGQVGAVATLLGFNPSRFGSGARDQTALDLAGARNPTEVEGSKEYWEELARTIQERILRDAQEVFDDRDPTAEVDIDQYEYGATELRAIDSATTRIAALRQEAAEKIALLGGNKYRNASAEDRDALIEEISAIHSQIELDMENLIQAHGERFEETRESVNRIVKRLGQLDTDISLGRITIPEAVAEATRLAAEQRLNALDYKGNDQQEYEDTLAKADEAELQAVALRQRALQTQLSQIDLFFKNRQALSRKIAATSQRLAEFSPEDFGTAEFNDLFNDRLELNRQMILANLDAAKAETNHAIQMAKTFEERQEAIRKHIAALRKSLALTADPDDRDAIRREADSLQRSSAEEQANQRTRELVATKRLAGPILSEQIKIESQLIEANRQLTSQYSSLADKLEAQIKIRELLAQAQQNELARLVAVRLAQVSVRDSMGELFVEIEKLRQEATLAAEQYGKGSAAANTAARAVKAAEASMIDLVLELESNNRQLAPGFDVTNPLHAAEEAWIKAMRYLQIPDLGAAERAAGEVAEDVARANLLQSQYDDELFSLQFQHEQGSLGTNAYISALQAMLATVDISTHQGMKLWMQINGLIEGLTGEIAGQAFNIPGQIRIPTLFEVRRAVQAESMGVNYQDNRQQDINVFVSDAVSLQTVMETLESVFEVEASRSAPGGAGITIGGF